VAIPLFISTAIATPLLPALARCSDDRDAFRETLANSLLWVILLSLPASIGIAILAPRIPGILHWPADFASAVVPLRILALQPTIVAVDIIMGTAIIAVHRERRWLVVAFAGATFAIIGNLIAQPLAQHLTGNGAIGAAYVEIGTESLFFIGALILLPATYRPIGLPLTLLRAALSAVAMLAVGIALLPHSLPLAVVASTATYGAVAAATGFVRIGQLQTMMRVLIERPEV
jgi:O-antigen/teichoic acid export membrane protein